MLKDEKLKWINNVLIHSETDQPVAWRSINLFDESILLIPFMKVTSGIVDYDMYINEFFNIFPKIRELHEIKEKDKLIDWTYFEKDNDNLIQLSFENEPITNIKNKVSPPMDIIEPFGFGDGPPSTLNKSEFTFIKFLQKKFKTCAVDFFHILKSNKTMHVIFQEKSNTTKSQKRNIESFLFLITLFNPDIFKTKDEKDIIVDSLKKNTFVNALIEIILKTKLNSIEELKRRLDEYFNYYSHENISNANKSYVLYLISNFQKQYLNRSQLIIYFNLAFNLF